MLLRRYCSDVRQLIEQLRGLGVRRNEHHGPSWDMLVSVVTSTKT